MSVQSITTKAAEVKVGDRITEAPAGGWVTVEREVPDAEPGHYRTPSGALYVVHDDGSVSNLVHTKARALPSAAVPVIIRPLPEAIEQHREAVDIITRDVFVQYLRLQNPRHLRWRAPVGELFGVRAVNSTRSAHGLEPLTERDAR